MHGPPETDVSPAPQSKQLGLPTVEDCPAGQFAQPVASELLANWPGTHSAHWCLVPSDHVPAGQRSRRALTQAEPAGQAWQTPLPSRYSRLRQLLFWPSSHTQPSGHGTQEACPPREIRSPGHRLRRPIVQKLPAEQYRQPPESPPYSASQA